MITDEQAERAKEIIIETLDAYYKDDLPYHDVWVKPIEDFDGVDFLKVWVIYDGPPHIVSPKASLNYGTHLYMTMLDAGIRALPGVSYLPQSDVDEMGKEWLMAG